MGPRHCTVLVAILAFMAAAAAFLLWFKLRRQPPFIDYLTMWTGGKAALAAPERLYDFPHIDRAQAWLLGAAAYDRPFPYPPSSLLVFAPLARLSFWVSASLWTVGGIVTYALAISRLAGARGVWVLVATAVLPGVVWAGLSGQCAFAVGALLILGMGRLDHRPWLAGAALGLVLALKPTLLLMAPLMLLAGGQWRAFIATGLTGLAAIGLSALAFGIRPWIDWVIVAPGYLARISEDPRYITGIIAPSVLANRLGFGPGAALAWRLAWIAVGALIAVVAGRRKGLPTAGRVTAMVVASLVASPYAMNYETTLLAPGAAIALVAADDLKTRILAVAAYCVLALAGLPTIGAYAFLAYAVLAAAQLSLSSDLLGHSRPMAA